MRKNISYIFVGLTLAAILFASCGNTKRKDGRTDTNSSGTISFVSDESLVLSSMNSFRCLRPVVPMPRSIPYIPIRKTVSVC